MSRWMDHFIRFKSVRSHDDDDDNNNEKEICASKMIEHEAFAKRRHQRKRLKTLQFCTKQI